MILAVDIGNTTIHFALVRGDRIRTFPAVGTACPPAKLSRQLKMLAAKVRAKSAGKIRRAYICSVVPKQLPAVEKLIKRELKVAVRVIGRDCAVPIVNRYHNPRQVGQDRLLGAYAAKTLYGTPLVVVDLGTAITLDVVNKKGEYLGGIIVPGIRLSLESLFNKTALLPRVSIHAPRSVVGRSTRESMLSGIFYGYAAMIDGLIARLSKTLKSRPKVIITGGYAPLVKRYAKTIKTVEPALIFKGIGLLDRREQAGQ